MAWEKHSGWWAMPLLVTIFVAITFWLWFSHYYDFADICPADEADQLARCAREWIGVLGAYVATVFAGVTIYYLAAQIGEQRKQTDFQLGDALPVMDVVQDLDDPEEIVVRVVNWNRRGVLIEEITIRGVPNAQYAVMEYKRDDKDVPLTKPSYLRGRENRSEAPHTVQFKLSASVEDKLVKDWPQTTSVEIVVQIFDARHRRETLSGELHLQPQHDVSVG